MSEHDEQVAVVNWFEIQYPSIKHLILAYPSGAIFGGKNKWGMINKLKKEGWKKGIPDLFIPIANRGYFGLWIEMKDEGKKHSSLSEYQIFYLDELDKKGYKAIWCSGSQEAISAIKEYME